VTITRKEVAMRRTAAALALLLAATAWILATPPAMAAPTTYYVDATAGNDSNSGTSTSAPWRSLQKVNGTTFQPGDVIQFRAGAVWNGQLWPKGSGTSAAPIKIDRYGDGPKPLINGGGNIQGTVYLRDQPHWEIRSLEVTNTKASRDYLVGIKVHNTTRGRLDGVTIADNTVHDVKGYQSGYYGQNGGIAVVADADKSYWKGVRIENNTVYNVDRIGIFVGPTVQEGLVAGPWQAYAHTDDVVIQNNTIDNSGGDGILNFVTSNVVVQHNVVSNSGGRVHNEDSVHTGYVNSASAGIWSAVSTNTLIQYNEVYNDISIKDGQGYDIDLGSRSTYLQYNYSHNNRGGFVLICEIAEQGVDINNARIRFNISQNDKSGVFTLCGDYTKGPDHLDINNNTIYLGPASTANVMRRYNGDTAYGRAYIYNNIFYTLGNNPYLRLTDTVFDYNSFYGRHHAREPQGGHRLTSDPRLVAPGSGYLGRGTVDGYKLATGSPALAGGTDTGVLGDRDYWGNPVGSGTPNIGAYNGAGVSPGDVNLAFNATVTSSSSVECCSFLRPNLVDGSRNSISQESAGFSSATGILNQHEEWVAVEFAERKTFSSVVLYPRNDPGHVGRGFPQHFYIQVWDGQKWLTRKEVTGGGSPSTPQTYSWGHTDTTHGVRILIDKADGLQNTSDGYVLQLAELEVRP
jgi:hypothetical protein